MRDPITPAEVEALEALLAKATQRPWKALDYNGCRATFIEPNINCGNGYEGEIKIEDARLIVAAVNALPRLLASLRAQDAAVERALRACAETALALVNHRDEYRIDAAIAAGVAALKPGVGGA